MHGAFRKSVIFLRAGRLTVVAVGCLLSAAGCSSGDQTSQATGAAAAKSHKQKKSGAPTRPGELALSDMVAAVSSAKGPPLELKFSLPTRPEVGQVTEIDVALVPSLPLPDSVSISFQVAEGLEIVEGAQLERVEKLTAGTPIRHVLKVLPKRDGIFSLSAVVAFTNSDVESNRTYSIPVIAGEGMPDQVAKGP